MTTVENKLKSSKTGGKKRWSRVREAYQAGELDRQNAIFQSEQKRTRRHGLADISDVSTSANATNQQYQFQKLVNRVHELQKEIVPDLLLYQLPQTYSGFSSLTSNPNPTQTSLPLFPDRQSLSLNSSSTNSLVPNQRFSLSKRILQRAHDIPERFWIDWQQKQMQDQIEELEYIKNNMTFSSNSSLFSNETDENNRPNYDRIRRESLLFLHEAQRLANQRRASLAQTMSVEKSPENDDDDDQIFNFEQRSEETNDTANLSDFKQQQQQQQPSSPIVKHSRLPITLPFTYINQQEPMISKRISFDSPTNIADIDTEVNVMLVKREVPKPIDPILFSKATVNRSIRFRSKSSNRIIPIHVSIPHRSSSPTLSFKSARSRLSSIDSTHDHDYQSTTVIPSSPSLSNLSTITTNYNHTNDIHYSLLKHSFSSHCICSIRNQSMIDINNLESNFVTSPSFISNSLKQSTQNMPRSRTLLVCSCKQQCERKKEKVCQAKVNEDNNNNNIDHRRTFKIANNTSIIFSEKNREWKENVSGFHQDVLTSDNNEENDDDYDNNNSENINRPSASSPVAAVAGCLSLYQRRKQTRLKRKTGSEKRKKEKEKKKEKKKKKKKGKEKKERNKKSPSSTSEAEATDASLFQFSAVDTSTGFYPHERTRCADKSTNNEQNCCSKQTSKDQDHQQHYQQQQKQEYQVDVIMPDGYNHTTDSNPTVKKKENLRIFVRHHRRQLNKQTKRNFHYSSTSSNSSHETISSTSSSHVNELVELIQKKINYKQKKNSRQNKNIIVVNYKPVFINSQQKQQTKKPSTIFPVDRPKIILTDDDFSSATHYSRRRSLTTTSSDGSPRRSTSNRSQHQSLSVDLPDVEDPLVFIEMMYQQLFTEDGQLRTGTEPSALANCVKQIVTNSRRNSISASSIVNGSTSPAHVKQMKSTYQSFLSTTKPISQSSSPRLIPNESYEANSDDDDDEGEEPQTIIPNNQIHSDLSKRNLKRIINRDNDHSQTQTSYQDKRHLTVNNTFSFSIDDTDNEDLDTFSDFNSLRLNNKPNQVSPSIDDDLTHTDSKLLSSSGYHSSDRSKPIRSSSQRLIRLKSHSDTDLTHSTQKLSPVSSQRECIHYCPNCILPPTITVIPSSNSPLNFFQRIQQPLGLMLMKYLNFLFISKHVLLLPLFVFLLRQRSMHIGN